MIMGKLTIVTNNVPRELLYWYELTGDEQNEFDWIETDEQDQYEFFRYKGWTYCLADFMRIEHHNDADFSAWDSYSNDSFFSGVLIKYPRDDWGLDSERIIVGWYYS
jgi:hypothetical protein